MDVLGSFRQYVVQNEERMQGLKDQISSLESAVRAKSAAVHQAKIETQSSEGYQGGWRAFSLKLYNSIIFIFTFFLFLSRDY